MLSAALLVLTLLWKDWIELVFRFDPDAGSGAVEWTVVAIALVVTIAFAVAARLERRRAAPQNHLALAECLARAA